MDRREIVNRITCNLPYIACALLTFAKLGSYPAYFYIIFASLAALYCFPGKILLGKKGDGGMSLHKFLMYVGQFFYFSILGLSILLLLTPATVFTSAFHLVTMAYLLFYLFYCSFSKVGGCELINAIGFYVLACLVYFI